MTWHSIFNSLYCGHISAVFPIRINLDRRGLHGVPVLADEPGLRLLSLQHNFIKRIHNLEFTSRLVFLDLYHNRLDQIAVTTALFA